ncbi:MAG: YabP/YqfC family sporulation protein [Clostridia bacterium]|nr:YabP/YqfC family sporulation protein [Clostridia bacterium]
MQERNDLKNHSVHIEQKKELSVVGVESVVAFSDVKIVLALTGGEKMNVVGTGLKITGFSKNSGSFTAEGNVLGVSYGAKSIASRIFK